ncbi:MAG: shikimate dehydrogenase [Steroidobacteraceae bacterium]|jgi:shikimate dehydrogenase|nr:shikimate dehydrogenase [Gammaproteobacteria bacterium]
MSETTRPAAVHAPEGVAPDRYGVVGHPIAHSRSPFIHARFAAATTQNLIYDRYDIAPERFEADVRALFAAGLRGLNVTVPHKEAAARLADRLTDRAQRAGAVNTLALQADGRLLGDNTDGAGLVADFEFLRVAVCDKRVLILGAGGATRGILAPLLGKNPAALAIANRRLPRATELQQAFADLAPIVACTYEDLPREIAAHGAFDLVIHATSAGIEGKLPAVDASIFARGAYAYDLGYAATDTPFVRWARSVGIEHAAQGLGMLVEQAAESFFLWRGVRPDTTAVRAALREAG